MEGNFLYNHIVLIPIIAYAIVIVLKIFFSKQEGGSTSLGKIFLGSGGMPSAHTAITSSLAASLFLKYGAGSDYFALAFIFLVIVTYDAISIRYNAGLHAKEINVLIGNKKYNETLGHLPIEAFVGIFIGIVVSLGLYYI